MQHLAAAVGTPCVSLFSFWQMRGRWHHYGARNVVIQKWVPCHTCLLDECPIGNACMKAIQVEEVVRHAAGMLGPDRERGSSTAAPGLAGAKAVAAAQGQSA